MIMQKDCNAGVYVMWQPCKDNECKYLHQLKTGVLQDANGQHFVMLEMFGTRKVYLAEIRLATLDEIKAGRNE